MNKTALTPKERDLLTMMEARFLVPMLVGPPGGGKTAIFTSICEKMGYVPLVMNVPTLDEVDLGAGAKNRSLLETIKSRMECERTAYGEVRSETIREFERTKEDVVYMSHPLPEWVINITNHPETTFMLIINEANRASGALLNAMLGITNERTVGGVGGVRLPDNCLIGATGNLGDEDGCDVSEFDRAQGGRFIRVPMYQDFAGWYNDYAKDNVHPMICKFLEENIKYFNPPLKDQGEYFLDGRRWDALSKAIVASFGKDATVDEYGDFLTRVGTHYVGPAALKLVDYANANKEITLPQILEGKVKNYKKIPRANAASLVKDIVASDVCIDENDTPGLKHVIAFAKSLDDDQMYGLVSEVMAKALVKYSKAIKDKKGSVLTGNAKKWRDTVMPWLKEFEERGTA